MTGAIVRLVPTTSTTWNETATVRHPLQWLTAIAVLRSVTGAPFLTVTSE